MSIRLTTLAALVSAAVLTLAAGRAVKAAQTAQPPDPLTALLAEVRALRIAMERTATVTPRVQLTVARLNIEEERLAHLGADLDAVRRDLSNAALEAQKLRDQQADLEKELPATADETHRRAMSYELEDLKRRIAAMARSEQSLRARESDAAQTIGAEQSRWVDLNNRLDELERMLGPVPR